MSMEPENIEETGRLLYRRIGTEDYYVLGSIDKKDIVALFPEKLPGKPNNHYAWTGKHSDFRKQFTTIRWYD